MNNIKEILDHCVFLLGAGASYDADCKMSGGMLSALKDEIVKDESEIFHPTQKEALKFLLSCLYYHNSWRSFETNNKFTFEPNIEELALLIRRIKNRENFLPYPITGNWADKLNALESEFKRDNPNGKSLFESLDTILKQKLLPIWLQLNEGNLNFLDPLKNMLEQYSNIEFNFELFTLNNDLVIETYFEKYKMIPWRGFNNNDWRGMKFKDTKEIFDKINLYKLHGSLDWVRLETGEVKIKQYCSDNEREIIDKQHDPYVIFGHGAKTFSVDPFFSLIHNFRESLETRNYIFVIGYSFFDTYINNLLLEAVNRGSKKLIIVNPDFGPNPKDYHSKEEFENFLEALTSNNNKVDKLLVTYIEAIQQNPFYSELPEFNITKINGENIIFYIKKGVKDFLDYFFSNGAKNFINLISHFETEKEKEENPF
jgi:hypothetical protein